MARRFASLSWLAVLAAASMPVQAKNPLRLAPSSQWHVNYAADSCRMGRSFGTGDNEVILVLDRFQPGPMVFMSLMGKLAKVRSDVRKTVVRFGPNEREQRRNFDLVTRDNGTPVMMIGGSVLVAGSNEAWEASQIERDEREDGAAPTPLPFIDPALNASVTSVEIDIPGRGPVLLETGAMGKPMEALTGCTSDLLRGWGIDVAAHEKLSRPAVPAGNPGRWITASDYPLQMRDGRQGGLVHFRLIVDETGNPKSCHIQKSTRAKVFEDAVCEGIMKRAKFEPALDAAGKPVASYYLNRVRFQM